MTTTEFQFTDVEPPTERLDSVPPTIDVDNPCNTCGNEAGLTPTGRKRKHCSNCRPTPTSRSGGGVRISGNAQTLAAQAAKTLANVNSMIAMGLGGFGFFRSMQALMEQNESFEQAAYAALLTDTKMCQTIVSVGTVSAKASLGMAYLSLGMGLAPVIAEEIREKKERAALAEQGA